MAEPQNPERLLKVENLDVAYGATRVVWDVSLEVDRRQVVSLIGPNGAGKTTLLKALAGLLPVRKGKIIFDGKDISSEPAHERVQHHLALVPEGRQLWSRMTVEENLLMGGFSPQLRSKAHSNLERIYELFPRRKERRKQLAKQVSEIAEDHRVAVRNIRHASNDLLKKLLKDKTISEDDERGGLDQVQKHTNTFISKIDELAKNKEQEIMSV